MLTDLPNLRALSGAWATMWSQPVPPLPSLLQRSIVETPRNNMPYFHTVVPQATIPRRSERYASPCLWVMARL